MQKRTYIFIAATLALILPIGVSSAVMSSTNYKVQSDSLNFGGGYSTSSSYSLQGTGGEVATGFSTSTNYKLHAGYQQMSQSFISLSAPSPGSPLALADVSGLAGGSSSASTTWIVTTDDPAGYSLSVQATSSPAMQGDHGDNIADYAPAGGVPDYNFSILSNQSAFGYSPTGVNAVSRYLNNGLACGTGSTNSLDKCWDGFSLTPRIIAQSSSGNAPTGATTTVTYQVGIGSARIQTAGSYSATITVTAVSL